LEGNLQSNLHNTRPIGVANTRTSRRGLRYYANQLTKDLQQLYRTSAMCGPCHSPLNNYGVHFITDRRKQKQLSSSSHVWWLAQRQPITVATGWRHWWAAAEAAAAAADDQLRY